MRNELPAKYFESITEYREAIKILLNLQKTHNIIRNDYLNLINLTFDHIENQKLFNTLYRSCLRELFSLIESDIFNLNRLDKYHNYTDNDKFIFKFKKTFKQICKTWKKDDVQKHYFDSKLEFLIIIKKERDKITHPKSPIVFKDVTLDNFNKLKLVFNQYDDFINEVMNNFFIRMRKSPNS
ncbi:MAG: hypothetical protein Q8S44_01185 [Flavobacteriaceae bacterium]|nr:hypothetical protein [Flavobacteriaceae bacterium]